jgi:molecular chaperone DnaK
VDYALGVDLGTSFTAAAVLVNDRAQIVRLGSRRAEIPSLVFVRDDGVVLVGDAAERRGPAEPARLAREFKRRLGDPVPVLVGGAPYSAHALMARVLEHVYETVVRNQEGPPSSVVVTHPANWGPYKRELLTQAVRMADVPHVQLRTEPETAAIQYAAQERVRPGEIIAVYDLGGGTFDAAVLRKTNTGFELLGEPAGVEQLGGVDFDEAVLAHVMHTLGPRVQHLDTDEPAVREALTQLRRDCITAKEDLSDDTEVLIPVALPSLHTRVRLNRSEFEAMISPVLNETIQAMRRALRSAGVSPDDLRSILLAGGSSRIPLVSQLLSSTFNKPLALDGDPAHNVALGAALVFRPTDPLPPTTNPGPGTKARFYSVERVLQQGNADDTAKPATPSVPASRGRRSRTLLAAGAAAVAALLVVGFAWVLAVR